MPTHQTSSHCQPTHEYDIGCCLQAAVVAAAASEFLTAEFRQDRMTIKGTELPVLSCTVSLQLFSGRSSGHAGRSGDHIDREDSAR